MSSYTAQDIPFAEPPVHWIYSYQANGRSLATFLGDVQFDGTIINLYEVGFNSIAAFAAAFILPGTSAVVVNGYYSAGDGGGALYIPASAGAGPGKVQTADGSWWIISQRTVTLEMLGAHGDGATNDSAALTAALAFGRPIYVTPGKTFMSNAQSVPSGAVIYSDSHAAVIKNRAPNTPGANLLDCGTSQNIIIRGLCIDGGYTLAAKGNSWAIAIGNGAAAFEPVLNRVTVEDCFVLGDGFGSIVIFNGGECNIAGNHCRATSDTCIALVGGSFRNRVVDNLCDSASFGISTSCQGVTSITQQGLCRSNTITGNVSFATKAGSYAYQLDGIAGNSYASNIAVINGGNWGWRIEALTAASVGSDKDCPVIDNAFAANTIELQVDASLSAVEFFANAAFDMTSNVFDGFAVWSSAAVAPVLPIAFTTDGGASVLLKNCSARGVNIGYQFSKNNIAGVTYGLENCSALACIFGLQATDSDANKATVTVKGCNFKGASSQNVIVGSGTNLVMFETPLNAPFFLATNTFGGEVLEPVTVAALPAAPIAGTKAFVTDATVATFATAPIGGGAVKVPVTGNGGAWQIG